MSYLKGLKLDFVKVEETVTVSWKQGSFMGIGGDWSQIYKRCKYALGEGYVQVYIDKDKPIPKKLKIDCRMRYGMNEGALFFVLDDHKNQPYQHRFIQNATQKMLYKANDIIQHVKICGVNIPDLSWVSGDYLNTIN